MIDENVNLRVQKGADESWDLEFINEKTDIAIDITGYTVYFTVKSKISDTDDEAVIKKDITSHTVPTSGKTKIIVTSTDTNISPDNYIFDVSLKTNLGEITKGIIQGIFTVEEPINQRANE